MQTSTAIPTVALIAKPSKAFGAWDAAKKRVRKVSFYGISILFLLLLSTTCPAQLVKAIKNHDIKEVEKLITEGADVNKEYNRNPTYPPLYFAILDNQIEMARLLLKSGADANRCCITYNAMTATKSCWRLIHYAVGTKNPEMVKLQNGWIVMSVTANGNPETNDNCHVMVVISKDGGETWGDPIIVGRGRTWEPMVIQLPNGELELFVSSEAQWWGTGTTIPQEILFARSTDNGETWTAFKRAAYSPDRRDGMPVAMVLKGNKGVLFAIEMVNDNGWGSPTFVKR